MPDKQQIVLSEEQTEVLLTSIRADGMLVLGSAERDALCQTVRTLRADVEKLVECRATDSVRATARAAVEHLNKEGCWLLSDATPEELDQIAEIVAKHFAAATTPAPVEQEETKR